MLILTCIIILKYWWKKYRWLSAILVVLILLLLIFLVKKVIRFIENRNIETEEWINIQEFSKTLNMEKEWKLQSYPEVIILSEIDGEIMSLNVSTWDIVEEYDILMNIKSADWVSSNYDINEIVNVMYDDYIEADREYREFQLENWDKIKELETQLYNDQSALVQAMEFNDKESRKILEKEIKKVSEEYNSLKSEQEYLKTKLNSLENDAQQALNESDKYYYKSEKQTPRAPFKWVIWEVYINEWEAVRNWDELITVINNNFTPEISISLDFDEYLLTKDLTWVYIVIENENRWDFSFEWEIYTRSPILNDEWKYTMTVKIINEDVLDLILDDENSVITVIFNINSTSEWLPDRCFKYIWKNSWVLTLRDWDETTDKEIWIKSKWNNWINVENLTLYSLENEEKIDWIDWYTIEVLCDIE